jgi:hypothetical protein
MLLKTKQKNVGIKDEESMKTLKVYDVVIGKVDGVVDIVNWDSITVVAKDALDAISEAKNIIKKMGYVSEVKLIRNNVQN